MAGSSRASYDPYRAWLEPPGRNDFEKLFNAEEYFMVPQSAVKDGKHLHRRKQAIQFIEMQSRTSRDFDALIPYMAMTYFDRLASSELKFSDQPVLKSSTENFYLCLICCLTIAWKLRTKNFVLSDFLNERNLRYSAKEVQSMEEFICRRLDWRLRTLTPFSFVEYFIPILVLPPAKPSPRRPVRQLIAKSQFDVAFTEYRPSVLAAAAILTVSSEMFRDKHEFFETKIITSEFLSPLKNMLLKCKKDIDPLFEVPDRDTAIRIDQKSDPIPEPGTSAAAAHAHVEAEQTHREGKAPVTSKEIVPAESDESNKTVTVVDPDELMDFELGWIQAQEEAKKLVVDRTRYGALLVEIISHCCSNFSLRCNIL